MINREKLIDKIPLDTPLCVYIEPTNKCNFNCMFCPTGNQLHSETGFMDMGLFNKIIDDLKQFDSKIETLALFLFGEPFLHKDIFEMISIAKRAEVAETVTVSTNGSLINIGMADKIIESGLDRIVFSIYDSYDVVPHASMLKKRRDKTSSDLEIVFKYFNDKENHEGMLEYCDKIVFESWFNWNYDFTYNTNIYLDPFVKYDARFCSQPFYVMALSWNGWILHCCADYRYRLHRGNVKINSVKDVWGKEKPFVNCSGCNYPSIIDEYSNIDKLKPCGD